MNVIINGDQYTITDFEEIHKLVPHNKIIDLIFQFIDFTTISDSTLTSLFRYYTNLRTLIIYNCRFPYLPENIFKYNTNLEELYLDIDKNTAIYLPEKIFKYNTKLCKLTLEGGTFLNLSKEHFKYIPEISVFLYSYNFMNKTRGFNMIDKFKKFYNL